MPGVKRTFRSQAAKSANDPEADVGVRLLDASFYGIKRSKYNAAQSIHSLTRAARSDGRDKSSLLKTVRLALVVNCVAPAIGRSAGFAPRKILST
jgi:hypothetical protein